MDRVPLSTLEDSCLRLRLSRESTNALRVVDLPSA
jgi:hypothetical protein